MVYRTPGGASSVRAQSLGEQALPVPLVLRSIPCYTGGKVQQGARVERRRDGEKPGGGEMRQSRGKGELPRAAPERRNTKGPVPYGEMHFDQGWVQKFYGRPRQAFSYGDEMELSL